jgi:hypothetical protein
MKQENPESSSYWPNVSERAAIEKHRIRLEAKAPAPPLKLLQNGGTVTFAPDHPHRDMASALLMEALGSVDADFVDGLLGHLLTASAEDGQINEAGIKFMLASIKDIKPTDQLEAMLAAQMAAVFRATMTCSGRLVGANEPRDQEIAASTLNKCARTFAILMDTLKRYRTGGEQTVTVQHVSVGVGGQAIVGNVNQAAPRTAPARFEDETPALTDARQPAMPIIGDRKRARVPLQRRQKNDRQPSP